MTATRVTLQTGDPRVEKHAPVEACDICSFERLEWRKCKLVCLACGGIVKSCADL